MPGVPQNVVVDPANLHPSFCAVEAQIEAADVDMSSYGVIVSLQTRKILRNLSRLSMISKGGDARPD